jgi:quercetin dioxygenase-like cupin family protein
MTESIVVRERSQLCSPARRHAARDACLTLALAALAVLVAAASRAADEPQPAVFDAIHRGERTTRPLAELLAEATLADGEEVRVTPLGRDAHASHHLVVLRSGEEIHRHDEHELHVVILRGHGTMQIGDRTLPAGQGSVMYVPRGVAHAFVNGSEAPAVALVTYTPPLDAPDRTPVTAPALD